MRKQSQKYRWIMFWILALGYVLVYFHRQCPAVLAVDLMRDLQVDGTIMGLFGSLYFYPYAVMQLPAGLLSDSLGPRKTITLFFLIAVAGSFLLGFAPGIAWAIAGRLLVGIGVAMLFVPTLKVLSRWFDAREFATMTGILMAMGGLGSMISAGPLAFLSTVLGWRNSFYIVGAFTLVLALMVWFVVRDRPSDPGWPPLVKGSGGDNGPISLRAGIAIVTRERGFWILGAWFFFTLAIFFPFAGLWGGPYLIDIHGLDRRQAGAVLSILAMGMIVGSPLLSLVSNSVVRSRKNVIVFSSAMNCVITAMLAFRTGSLPLPLLYALCFGMGVFASAVVAVAFTSNKELFPVGIAGTATGLINLFPFAGGAVFQQVLGAVLERSGRSGARFMLQGYESAFFVLFLCSLAALCLSFFIRETWERQGGRSS